MYRLLAFDIDNTLIMRGKSTIEESALEGIRQSVAKGLEVVICTGRTITAVHPDILKRMPVDYFIGVNGTCLNTIKGKVLHTIPMSKEDTERMIQLGLELDMPFGFKFDDSFQIYNHYETFTKRYCKNGITRDMLTDCSKTRDYHLKHNMPLDVFIYDDENAVPNYMKSFDSLKFVKAASHNYNIYEAFDSKGNKAVMLKILAEKLGYDMSEVMAFGDSDNDAEMLKASGLGICMGNGTESAKAAADYITDNIDADGVFKALKHFEII